MSEHKQVRVVASTNRGIVVGDGKRHRWRLHVRLWAIILLVVAIVAAVSGGMWAYYNDHHRKTTSSSNNMTASQGLSVNTVAKDQSITHQALGLALNGQVSAAQQLLSNAIAQTTSAMQKGLLYEQKANIAYGAGSYSQSLQYAQRAESLSPTADSANWIATDAMTLGQKPLALKYYKLELQRMGSTSGVVQGGDSAEIEANIQALGG